MADLISSASHYPGGPSSGTGSDSHDVTQVGGQDPASNFGIPMPYSTGAGTGSTPPGGESAQGVDPTNQPNQYPAADALTGVAYGTGTGVPGTPGVSTGDAEPGGQPVTVTRPGTFLAGPVGGQPGTQGVTVSTTLSGIGDSTGMTQQYPAAETITKVPLPHGTGAGQGRVLHGGFANGQRS